MTLRTLFSLAGLLFLLSGQAHAKLLTQALSSVSNLPIASLVYSWKDNLLYKIIMSDDSGNEANGIAEIKYFTNLTGVISPFLEYRPRGEITEEKSQKLNHYRVSYDESGRLLRIEYFRGTMPSNGAYFRTHMVHYTYQDQETIRSYYDRHHQPASMWRHYYQGGEIHREVYTQDGNITTLTLHDIDGKQVASGYGSYFFRRMTQNEHQFIQWQFKEDGSPNAFMNDYLPFDVVMITKDSNGHLDRVINLDSITLQPSNHAEAGFAEMRLDFDAYGNEYGWEFRDANEELVNRSADFEDPGYAQWLYDFTWYDEALGLYSGYEETYQDAHGNQFCRPGNVCGSRVAMDRYGNLKSIETFDQSNQLVVSPDSGYARLEVDMNGQGLRHEIRYYNADGELRTEGVAVQRFKYDAKGDQEEVAQLDYRLKPIETASS